MRSALSCLPAVLEMAVFEHFEGSSCTLSAPAPEWFLRFFPSAQEGTSLPVGSVFAFVENFLIDADNFWTTQQPGQLGSGPWIETDYSGREWALEAYAAQWEGRRLLLIQHVSERYENESRILQSARMNLLSNEQLEKEVRRRTEQIRQREEEIALRLLAVVGIRDEETGAHVRRIGLYSAAIASALGWDAEQVDNIRVAAPMHDIGKIGIPDIVFLKPGKLSTAEFEIMKRHPELGARMLEGSNIPLLQMAREIVLCHHEKWNGEGYPRGLKGDAIPESARIVAIVDVYDALIHKRIYKQAKTEHEVLAYMAEASGTHFDPKLFAVFMSILPQIRQIRESVLEQD